ncbi:MAG TPA: CAP domain-containing protein [Sporichthyaceae bacterium]|jgi:uncharacterized protein YkwD
MHRRRVLQAGVLAAAVSASVLIGPVSQAAPGAVGAQRVGHAARLHTARPANGAPVPTGGLYDAGVPTVAGTPNPAPQPAPPAPAPVPSPQPTPMPTPGPAAPGTSVPPPAPAPAPTPGNPAPAPNPAPTPTPSPVPTPPPAGPVVPPPPPPAPGPSHNITELLALTNQDRLNNGCAALTPNPALMRAALGHAQDMAQRDYFSHTSLDGRTYDQRIRQAGFDGDDIGENIASGFPDARGVQDAWMDHAGHRRNILDCNFKWVGMAYVPNGQYWVVDFGG